MNYVFYGLVALSMLFAALTGTPTHEVKRQGTNVAVVLAADSPVKVGSEVQLGACTTKVTALDAATHTGTLDVAQCSDASGTTARFPEEYGAARMSKGALDGAKSSVDLAIGLAGAMTLFMGLMKVLEVAGAMNTLARWIRPLMVRLFPDVPADHPAMGAMILNIAANVLGLGNAATPFGIRAMQELEKLNRTPGVATNAMVRFLAINTAGLAVLPTGVIAVRAAAGSKDPAAIFLPTLLATAFGTVFAIASCWVIERMSPVPAPTIELPPAEDRAEAPAAPQGLRAFLPLVGAVGALVALVVTVYRVGANASAWIIPALIFAMLTVGVVRGVKVYETFLEGAREGFQSATRIIPYLVAVLTAIGMFRGSGGLDMLVRGLGPVCNAVGMPPETLPLALLRSLSGTGAFALMTDLTKSYGPDTLIGQVAGTMQGSSETTFYVLAVYFGAVGVTRSRHAISVGLLADVAGAVGSIVAVHWLLG